MIEDVLPELSKARVFTKVDACNGYWHVALVEDSAKLTTFVNLKCTEFPYLAHFVTKEDLKPDLDKIKAVQEMLRLGNIKAVRRFCGFVNYLAKFMLKLSEVMEPISNLTCKENEWKWTHEHDAAFKRIKEMATTSPLLKYYNPDDELIFQCNNSEIGLGAAVLQKGPPVAFASHVLTDTEFRYVQIEKELLTVVFALDKFEQYTYGRPVTMESSHKPLEAIAKKPLRCAPKRLQGMFCKIQKFDINIVYNPET